jgi:hypothetical protein
LRSVRHPSLVEYPWIERESQRRGVLQSKSSQWILCLNYYLPRGKCNVEQDTFQNHHSLSIYLSLSPALSLSLSLSLLLSLTLCLYFSTSLSLSLSPSFSKTLSLSLPLYLTLSLFYSLPLSISL